MLEVRNLTKKYGLLTAVDRLSFNLNPGEVLGCLGPNGAGKSTTMKLIAGLAEPSSGEILLDGREIRRDLQAFKSRLGYVPEQAELYPHLSGLEYLLLTGRLRGIPEKELQWKSAEMLAGLGLSKAAHQEVSTYSKGMRQKVLLASALLHDPDILLLDEPLSGLDVASTLVIQELITRLAAGGKMVLYSSHVLELTEKICSRVLIIHQGRLAACDSVENLRRIMQLPSLTDIFRQLALREDPAEQAGKIFSIMKSAN